MLEKPKIEKNKNLEEGIRFSVDAGIINRLGKELVGRAETAVSELVKNAYDADATQVELRFINTDAKGGTLQISDNGIGMTKEQLVNGFMRLSSSEKVHNPVSDIYKRLRAGRKGIGRFATHRIGEKLTIITKSKDDPTGLKVEIDWNQYEMDKELGAIVNPIDEFEVDFDHGATLVISDLREAWTEAQIRRVFRYVSDLLQPDFLSDRSTQISIGQVGGEGSFNVICSKINDASTTVIADVDSMMFDHALGVIEGYVIDGQASCEVVSKRFDINDQIDIEGDFSALKEEIHFKTYYFIYSYEYYEGFIPKMEYKRIEQLAKDRYGIKLYRNGFRVLPYGERGDDWLKIDLSDPRGKDDEGEFYIPFTNLNFFGFVEIIDPNGDIFEETSSREGLIENQALIQVTDFTNKALKAAAQRINSARAAQRRANRVGTPPGSSPPPTKPPKPPKDALTDLKGGDKDTDETIDFVIAQLEELEMLRVLAAVGLSIAEFTHEIRQFDPSFNGSIDYLMTKELDKDGQESLDNLKNNFNRFRSYTAFIDHTIAQNAHRDKQPINLEIAVTEFKRLVRHDADDLELNFETEFYDGELYTKPMHPSEWTSVLYNLYTNAKKAIAKKVPSSRKIKIICGKEGENVYLEFLDNGCGIPESNKGRVFEPFFTTSSPPSFDAPKNETVSGSGLGLKIIRDIVNSYHGDIAIVDPVEDYVTNFRIDIPQASIETLEQYGY